MSPNSSSFPTFLFPARCRERLATNQQQSTGAGQQPTRGRWSGEHCRSIELYILDILSQAKPCKPKLAAGLSNHFFLYLGSSTSSFFFF